MRPLPGHLWDVEGCLYIRVPLHPFTLNIGEGGSEVKIETSLRLAKVGLSSERFELLTGRTFTFPVNPEDGYIDGSIYIEHAHHPVDITAIRFGSLVGEAIEVEFEGNLVLEFEGLENFANTRWLCRTHLSRSDGAPFG